MELQSPELSEYQPKEWHLLSLTTVNTCNTQCDLATPLALSFLDLLPLSLLPGSCTSLVLFHLLHFA